MMASYLSRLVRALAKSGVQKQEQGKLIKHTVVIDLAGDAGHAADHATESL